MCDMCEGATLEEVRHDMVERIEQHGWMVQGVEASADEVPWAYTIGLAHAFHHPELVLAGPFRLRDAGAILNELANRIRAGERFEAGTTTLLQGAEVGFVAVHPEHIEGGLVGTWFLYDDQLPEPLRDPMPIQVLIPDRGMCWCHQESQPWLDGPGGFTHGPNRAERRARERSGRRRKGMSRGPRNRR